MEPDTSSQSAIPPQMPVTPATQRRSAHHIARTPDDKPRSSSKKTDATNGPAPPCFYDLIKSLLRMVSKGKGRGFAVGRITWAGVVGGRLVKGRGLTGV